MIRLHWTRTKSGNYRADHGRLRAELRRDHPTNTWYVFVWPRRGPWQWRQPRDEQGMRGYSHTYAKRVARRRIEFETGELRKEGR